MNRTVLRAMDMLNYIGNNPHGVTLQNISEVMDIPKSSAFVILQTLLELNYIMTNKDNDKKYHIGVEAFSLGMKYATEMDLTKETGSVLNPLADKYAKTAFVGILDGADIVYLQKYKAEKAVLASCELGSRKPAHATALGKVILANLEKDELERVIKMSKFEKVTDYTIGSEEELRQELEKIRSRGYALDVKENNTHLACCAAPIFDYSKRVIAAVSLSDMYKENENMKAQAEELCSVAYEISRKLGYR